MQLAIDFKKPSNEHLFRLQAVKNPFSIDSQAYLLLERLKCGPCTNAEFVWKMGQPNFRSRLTDIRKKGFVINNKHLHDALWEYELEIV